MQEANMAFAQKPLAQITLPDIPYSQAAFKEILRLYPSVWLVGRRALADDALGSYLIKANDTLLICPFAIHRHPRYWSEPETFNPERFLTNKDKVSKYAYLPFGMGPRTCIGNSMASLQGPMIISALTKNFTIRFENNELISPDPKMFLRTKNRGQAFLCRR